MPVPPSQLGTGVVYHSHGGEEVRGTSADIDDVLPEAEQPEGSGCGCSCSVKICLHLVDDDHGSGLLCDPRDLRFRV